MSTLTSEIEKIPLRVQKGIDLLNEKIPDWPNRINFKTLEMQSTCNCILGQLFTAAHHPNPYKLGIDNLFPETDDGRIKSGQHGFSSFVNHWNNSSDINNYYEALELEWVKQIKTIRGVYKFL